LEGVAGTALYWQKRVNRLAQIGDR
jgi:hypothetical protein